MAILSNESDKHLVNSMQDNDVAAFDTLFHRYSERLYRFAYSLLKNEEDAKEIVQETFFRIWNKRDEVDTTKSFKSFLFSISYNLIVDQLRYRLRDKSYRDYLTKYFELNSNAGFDKFDFDNLVSEIRKAVDELPAKRKQVYILSREAGLSNNEIAAKLGISVKTVENQITMALKHIKVRLGKDVLAVILFISLFA